MRRAELRGQVGEWVFFSGSLLAALQIHVDEKHTAHLRAALQRTFYSRTTFNNFQTTRHTSEVTDSECTSVRPQRRDPEFARAQQHHPIAARALLHVSTMAVNYVSMMVISPPTGSGSNYNNTVRTLHKLHLGRTFRISAFTCMQTCLAPSLLFLWL